MRTIPVLTHYLEMYERPDFIDLEPPQEDLSFERVKDISVEDYRSIYTAVGGPYGWFDRVLMEDEDLEKILRDKGTEIFILKVKDEVAGYCEIDRREGEDVEIAFLALKKKFHRKHIGRYLLNRALNEAWSEETIRVWLHTCEWDHEAAIPMYKNAGFRIYSRDYHDQKVPDDFEISMLDP